MNAISQSPVQRHPLRRGMNAIRKAGKQEARKETKRPPQHFPAINPLHPSHSSKSEFLPSCFPYSSINATTPSNRSRPHSCLPAFLTKQPRVQRKPRRTEMNAVRKAGKHLGERNSLHRLGNRSMHEKDRALPLGLLIQNSTFALVP